MDVLETTFEKGDEHRIRNQALLVVVFVALCIVLLCCVVSLIWKIHFYLFTLLTHCGRRKDAASVTFSHHRRRETTKLRLFGTDNNACVHVIILRRNVGVLTLVCCCYSSINDINDDCAEDETSAYSMCCGCSYSSIHINDDNDEFQAKNQRSSHPVNAPAYL